MIVAVTLTPVMCSYLLTGDKVLRKSEKEPFLARWLKKIYRPALEWVLGHKRAVLGSTVGLFVVSLIIFFSLGRSLPAPVQRGVIYDQCRHDARHSLSKSPIKWGATWKRYC